jgi:hypothetical protein
VSQEFLHCGVDYLINQILLFETKPHSNIWGGRDF